MALHRDDILYHLVAIIIVVILGAIFFWFVLRPAQIRARCEDETRSMAEFAGSGYEMCLRVNGVSLPK
jgi:uncharacterized membrane protein